MHKCLLCGNGYHSTLNCRVNKEKMNIDLSKEQPVVRRRKYKRRKMKSKKIRNQKVRDRQEVDFEGRKDQGNQVKIQASFTSFEKRFREEEKMWNWKHYSISWNI